MEHFKEASQLASALADEVGMASADAFRSALHRACAATWTAVLSWAHVFWLFALPAWRITSLVSSAVWPHVRHGTMRAWGAFAAQEYRWIAAELAAVLAVLLCWLLKRHIRRHRYIPRLKSGWRRLSSRIDARYTALLASIRSKSLTLAVLFPHIAYAGVVGTVAFFAPAAASGVSEFTCVFSILFPLAATFAALRAAEPAAEVHWLQYWVLYGLIELVRGIVRALPILSSATAALLRVWPQLPLVELCGYAWLHLPRAHATDLAFERARTLVHAAAPLSARAKSEWAGMQSVLSYGIALLGRSVGGSVLAGLRDSGAMLLALLFLPMPAPITHVGCLLFGLGYPAYTAVGALAALEEAAALAARRALEPAEARRTPSAVTRVSDALWRSADKLRRRTSAAVRADEPALTPRRDALEPAAGGTAIARASPAFTPRSPAGSAQLAASPCAPKQPPSSASASASASEPVGCSAERHLVRARLQYWLVRLLFVLALAPFRPLLEWLPLVEQCELCAVVLLQLPYVNGCAHTPAHADKHARRSRQPSRRASTRR